MFCRVANFTMEVEIYDGIDAFDAGFTPLCALQTAFSYKVSLQRFIG